MEDRSHVRRRTGAPAGGPLAKGAPEALLGALPPAPERLVILVLELPLLEAALAHVRRRGADPPSALAAVDLEPDEDRLRLFELLCRQRSEDEPTSEKSPTDLRT